MKINHTKMHYAIGLTALVLAGYGTLAPPAPVQIAPIHELQKPSAFDWASLGQEKTEALADALKDLPPGKITFFCQNATCHNLMLDLDDAFQIVGWHESLQMLPVESEEDAGIFVGPPGPDASKMVEILQKTTGLSPAIVDIQGEDGKPIEGLGIIIGKVAR